MSNKLQPNQKHMNQEDRVIIEKGLDASRALNSIAADLCKDPTTIAKEIKKHRVFQEHNKFNEPTLRCVLAKDCHLKHVCSMVLYCDKECRRCPRCHNFCKSFVPFDYHCPKTDKAPYVCNACHKRSGCRLDKYYYRAVRAQREYKTVLVESRTGINATEDELALLDAVVSPLVTQGQSIYMILQNHPAIRQCEKTVYNYVNSGILSIGNLDLPKKVKYKPRKAHASEIDNAPDFDRQGRRIPAC